MNTTRALAACCCLATLLAGCRNSPPTMPVDEDPWQAARMPQMTLGSSLSAIAFSGDRGLALGLAAGKATTSYMLLERGANGAWTPATLDDLPNTAVLVDLAVSAGGIVAGGLAKQGSDTCLVHDERDMLVGNTERPGLGIAAVDGDDALMVAGGAGYGGVLWTSDTPQVWDIATTPLDPAHEGGFTDVFVGNGEALACGYDSGAATPQVLLRRQAGDGTWQAMPLGASIAGKTLQCVAAGEDGTMMLGGLDGSRAFAWKRGTDGIWRSLALPDGDLIGGVNDVLPAPGGVWYLACGGTGLATIIRMDGDTLKRDLKPFVGTVEQLARAADGTICAVGWTLTEGTGLRKALLLER